MIAEADPPEIRGRLPVPQTQARLFCFTLNILADWAWDEGNSRGGKQRLVAFVGFDTTPSPPLSPGAVTDGPVRSAAQTGNR